MVCRVKPAAVLAVLAFLLVVAFGVLYGCTPSGSQSAQTVSDSTTDSQSLTAEGDSDGFESGTPMNYISPSTLNRALERSDGTVIVLDLRAEGDYAVGHIDGAVNAPMHKAADGDYAEGEATLKAALGQVGDLSDKMVVLACYSGNRYAQLATDLLAAMGQDMTNVCTLKGGNNAWVEAGYAVVAD